MHPERCPTPKVVSDTVQQSAFADQPSGAAESGTYVKQVTIVVRDPRNTAKILARQTSLFDWSDGS